VGAERALTARLYQVDLHEARQVRGHRKPVEDGCGRAVPVGWHADAIGVDRGETASRFAEPTREAGAALVAAQGRNERVRRRGSCQLRPDVGHQYLAVRSE